MICYKTSMKNIPESCAVCALARPKPGVAQCPLPWYAEKMRKPCMRKRHKDCPLVEIDEKKE